MLAPWLDGLVVRPSAAILHATLRDPDPSPLSKCLRDPAQEALSVGHRAFYLGKGVLQQFRQSASHRPDGSA